MLMLTCLPLLVVGQAPQSGIEVVLNLDPGPNNPRNSEGDFIQLEDGRILFVYTHFTGGGGDHDSAYLAGRYSSDGGRTWTSEDSVILSNEGGMNVMSVSLLRLQDGAIGLFYLRKNDVYDCIPYLRRSTDEAQTWGEPVRCIPDDGYFVVNNDRVLQLPSGRLIVPASLHSERTEFVNRGKAMCYYSDDNGATWRRSKTVLEAPPDSRSGLQELGVVRLGDGRLMMFCRTDQGSQFRSYSEDDGVTWSQAEPMNLLSPVSPATIERLADTGELLIVWNNHEGIDPALKNKRTPHVIALSSDDGGTWTKHQTLEDNPEGWYCYTAMERVGDHVLLAYCAGDSTIGGLNRTRIVRVSLDWLRG
jgi:BNR repeat protein